MATGWASRLREDKGSTSQAEVVLVGRRLEDNENLGLGYLAAALAGLSKVERLVLNSADGLERVADAIFALAPRLVGLSIPDGGSAHLPLALGELLQRRKFPGHITAGGPFATLARSWLLERYPWLGSVVRFAGEEPLRCLIAALRDEAPLSSVPGLSTRAGDGPPAPVTSLLPMQLRPLRDPHPLILGCGVAHLQVTRGCIGRCAYCGPAALQTLEVAEGERAGVDGTTLRHLGVGAVRRRKNSEVCDELAALYRDNVRYCYFVDEHVLPPKERDALLFLADLRDGLAQRNIRRLGFGCMLRAELMTERLVDAFVEAGLVRAFIGVELATPAEGRRYRRRVDPEHARKILARLDAAGVATVTNLMLVHPDSSAASIGRALELLGQINVGTVETTRMQVYHGTRLATELEREGRLTGNPLRYGYRLADPAAERFTELLVRLRLQAFGDHSVGAAAHALALAVSLGARVEPERLPLRARETSRALCAAARDLYLKAYREALILAASTTNHAVDARGLVERTAEDARALVFRIESESRSLSTAFSAPRTLFVPMRAAASTSLVFALAASAACGGRVSDIDGQSSGGTGGSAAVGGANGMGGTAGNSGNASAGTATTLSCDEYFEQLVSTVKAQVPCFEGDVYRSSDGSLYASANYGLFGDCSTGDFLGASARAEAQSVVDAFSLRPVASCNNSRQISSTIDGIDKLDATATSCGWDGWSTSWVVVVDATGTVTDVAAGHRSPLSAEGLSCLLTALKGLTFPCFPNGRICPQEVILE